ncbi:MAG: nicotinate (nicotinamide) nucleotide adenylyltransferase [Clostridia bacterium]|nr:nicotinate (nicotinamide) nucleotide adenylyltransferase [Clostridia bacterium]
MKVGIVGGTFNPIHNGHIDMATHAYVNHGLDDILILPSGNPPHKDQQDLLDGSDRFEMCLLACMDHDHLLVESLELERKGTTYTIDSLQYYNDVYHLKDSLYYIIGGDTVLQLTSWREYQKVFKACRFIAFLRKGFDNDEILQCAEDLKKKFSLDIVFDETEIPDISSTDIRNRVRNKQSIKELVPERVEKYIYEHGLYK